MPPHRFRPTLTALEDRRTPSASPDQLVADVGFVRSSQVGLNELAGRLGDPWNLAERQAFATVLPGVADQNRAAAANLGEFFNALQSQITTNPAAASWLGGVGYTLFVAHTNSLNADTFATMFGAAPRSLVPPTVPPPPATTPTDSTPQSPPASPPPASPPPASPPPAPTNVAPTISSVPDQSTPVNQTVGPVNFTVSDAESAASDLNVTATSSNTTLIPQSGITLSGSGANRSILVTPAASQSGAAVITLTVTDPQGGTSTTNFTVSVTPAPTIPTADPSSIARDGSGLSLTPPALDSPLWQTQPSGIKILDVTQGTGATAQPHATVTINYIGWLASNGTKFDSSKDHNPPSTFPLDNLIQGWQLGIPGMKEGGTRYLFIPAALGYGAAGQPPSIPPNADLIFEIQLIQTQS
jgi:outer membrane biosynthesis protein TonB